MLCDTTQRASWCTWEGSTNPPSTSTADTQTPRIHSAPKIYQCVICRTKLCTRDLFIVCIFCTEIKQRKKKQYIDLRAATTAWTRRNNDLHCMLKIDMFFVMGIQTTTYFISFFGNVLALTFVGQLLSTTNHLFLGCFISERWVQGDQPSAMLCRVLWYEIWSFIGGRKPNGCHN